MFRAPLLSLSRACARYAQYYTAGLESRNDIALSIFAPQLVFAHAHAAFAAHPKVCTAAARPPAPRGVVCSSVACPLTPAVSHVRRMQGVRPGGERALGLRGVSRV